MTLENFRSYAAAELRPDPGLTVIAGPNGAGKTNLLEAVFVSITGRSHRAAVEQELVRHGSPFARVVMELDRGAAGAGVVELLLPGSVPPPGLRKRISVNGLPRRSAAVAEIVRVVLFRPEEMLLLVGAPGERRRFLDGILAQRDRAAARDLAELGRIVMQRNALLRAIRAEEAGFETLGIWDEQLALIGARVMAARLTVVRELGERIGPLHAAVVPGDASSEAVRLVYADALKDAWPERAEAGTRAPDAEELAAAYRRRIGDVRQKEAWNGVSLVGPQRDDLRVELDGRDVATHASRGQQRTIILALKLAETDLLAAGGAPPLVMLDDVFSELDAERTARLSSLLTARGQVLVTTADLATLDPVGRAGLPIWQISDGRLLPPEAA
ncbi:MAG: DNA replication/repair protein RecF [Candidatus Limnocylindria bacterium]